MPTKYHHRLVNPTWISLVPNQQAVQVTEALLNKQACRLVYNFAEENIANWILFAVITR